MLQLVVHRKVYTPIFGLKKVELGLEMSEKISPPPEGPLMIDQVPFAPVDAFNVTYSPPQEVVWLGPARDDKQELASMATLIEPSIGK